MRSGWPGSSSRSSGSLLFGVISTVAGGLTRWTAVLLSAGALVQLITIVATDHARDEWLMLVGAVAFGLSWILVGVSASRAERNPDRRSDWVTPMASARPSKPAGCSRPLPTLGPPIPRS